MILRHTYLRMTRWNLPPASIRGSLRQSAFAARPADIIEGYLLEDIRLGEPISFRGCFRLGRPDHRNYRSTPVVTIQGEFVLTCGALFQILRVPPTTAVNPAPGAWNAAGCMGHGVMSSFVRRAKRKYTRATVYSVPLNMSVPDLSTLALMGYPFAELEGYLNLRLRQGGKLRFYADAGGGRGHRVIHESAPIHCRQGNYFVTAYCLYHIQRLPEAMGANNYE